MKNNYLSAKATGLAAVTAIMAAAVFTSCNQDDELNNLSKQTDSKLMTRSAVTVNPEDLAENQHIGATITKNVPGYGDAKFTCISKKAPFYFVHVSERDYSAKEMDAMQYQQNDMAPDLATLDKLAQASEDYLQNYLGEPNGIGRYYEWDHYRYHVAVQIYLDTFRGQTDAYGEHEVKCKAQSADCWYRNSVHSYPYAYIWTQAIAHGEISHGIVENNHFCYASASSHRLMFYVVGHSANAKDQADYDEKYAPADSCHLGGTVTKHIENYGTAKFICVSDKAPYYFVHVSDTCYTAAQMDEMHYQQNEYAVTYDLLTSLANISHDMVKGILTKATSSTAFHDYMVATRYTYSNEECHAVCDKLNPYFKYFYCERRDGIFLTRNVWVKNNESSYPYGWICLDFSCAKVDPLTFNDYCAGGKNNYMCFKSAEDCYMMFAFKVE